MTNTVFITFFTLLSLIYVVSVSATAIQPNPPRAAIAIVPAPDAVLEKRIPTPTLQERTTPTFPAEPVSCPICEKDWTNINSCADACNIFANPAQIIFAPNTFFSTIECSCTDTFKSAFPQCADCFTQTNQTSYLNAKPGEIPSILNGMRQICAISSSLLGGVATTNHEKGTAPVPTATGAARGLSDMRAGTGGFGLSVVAGVSAIGGVLAGWLLVM
jgi:hypothetical protein